MPFFQLKNKQNPLAAFEWLGGSALAPRKKPQHKASLLRLSLLFQQQIKNLLALSYSQRQEILLVQLFKAPEVEQD